MPNEQEAKGRYAMSTTGKRERLDWRWRLVLSFLLAYPIGGALFALARIVLVFPLTHVTWDEITLVFSLLAIFTVMVPLFAGFPPKLIDDGSNEMYLNMYPFIVPTAAIVFFVWSRGWKWFGHRR